MFVYPHPDKIAFEIGPVHLFGHAFGPLQVHWYGITYLVGFLAGWWLARRRAARPGSTWSPLQVDDLIFFCAVGVILGGRLGWVLFYGTELISHEPARDLPHLGRRHVLPRRPDRRARRADVVRPQPARSTSATCSTSPRRLPAIGFGAGRIGNFINGELWGKPTDVPWAFVVDGKALHPSQLYEATLEGLVLFVIIWWFTSHAAAALGAYPACSWSATACSASWWSSSACRTRTAATCCSAGSRWARFCRRR